MPFRIKYHPFPLQTSVCFLRLCNSFFFLHEIQVIHLQFVSRIKVGLGGKIDKIIQRKTWEEKRCHILKDTSSIIMN